MRNFIITLALLVIVAPVAMATTDLNDDYIVAERPAFQPEGGLQSLSLGATTGPGGVHYLSLEVWYATDVAADDARRYAALRVASTNVHNTTSGVKARFVLDGVYPWTGASSGDTTTDLNAFHATRPFNGKFAALLIPRGEVSGRAFLNEGDPWEGMPLLWVESIEGWVMAGRPSEVPRTGTHEWGHTMGVRHNDECPTTMNPDGCGYTTSGGMGDIMSITGFPVVGQFSDPTVMVSGEPLGDENANAVRYLNSRLPAYAAITAPVVVPCDAGNDAAYLQGGRFQVHVCWRTPQGTSGPARLEFLNTESAFFYFFNNQNFEVLVKVKDACAPPFNRFWFFAAGLTNVEVTITVVDRDTDMVKTYHNPLGTAFAPIQDTDAFDTCP